MLSKGLSCVQTKNLFPTYRMSSVIRYATKAVKIPAGRKFHAQPDQQFLTSLNWEPYCFQQSDIDALLSSGFVKVSDSLYSAQTEAALDTVLTSLDNLDEYYFDSEEYTAVDLGKTIRIGLLYGDNDVITMRLVKRTGTVESLGGPTQFPNVCYIVTGNKRGGQYNSALYCSALGTTPNNRAKKPFLNNAGYRPNIVSVSTFESILSSIVQVSGSLYLARTVSEFNDLLNTFANGANYTTLPYTELSSIDLGKSVRIGIVGAENDLLVFRLVKRTGTVATAGEPSNSPSVGYICIASKINISDPEGAAEPAVTGTSPNLLEVKPQFLSSGDYNPTMFPEADIQSILADCVKVSDSLYLANTAAQLASVCGTLNNLTGRDRISYESTIDMGKTIRVGLVGGESDLLTFASIRGVTTQHPGVLTTAYTPVGSKISLEYDGALYVSVFGTAPRDS